MEVSKDVRIAVTLGGILVVASTAPQMIQTLVTKLTRDINLLFTIACVAGIAFYVYYAVKTDQKIFAIADGIDCAMWSVVLAMKVHNILNGTDSL